VSTSFIDSLKYTNYRPYVKNPIPDQLALAGELFTFTIPDSTFVDDDGNNTLTYHAKLTNGDPLPSWLTFDTLSATFLGIPPIIQTLNIKLTATDTAEVSVSTTLKITVNSPASIDPVNGQLEGVLIFPNPTIGLINISFDSFKGKNATFELRNPEGKILLMKSFENKMSIDLTGNPEGIYILKLHNDHVMIVRKVIMQ
jgi:hypothetical protein